MLVSEAGGSDGAADDECDTSDSALRPTAEAANEAATSSCSQPVQSGFTTIRTVRDIARLPLSELGPCLDALRKAIESAHARSPKIRGTRIHVAIDNFDSFLWRSSPGQLGVRLHRHTSIEDLNLRSGVQDVLRMLRIYCVEDLTAFSEADLRTLPSIGERSIARLRDSLRQAGLSFRNA